MPLTTANAYRFLLQWLIAVGAMTFALAVAWQHGALKTVFVADPSRISVAIAIVAMLTSAHAGTRLWQLTRELRQVAAVDARIASGGRPTINQHARLAIDEYELPESLFARHAQGLMETRTRAGRDDALYAALEREVVGAHQVGWLLTDLMVKLGLLGTVIGFIVMLGSVSHAQDFDLATLRNMLTEMSGGMRIALFTTLSGLGSGMLLGVQYHIVERAAHRLLDCITLTTETRLIPRWREPSA